MIFTTIGKPGGGKSYYSLKHIVNVLVNTDNSVVTNLSVNVAELHAYLCAKYPDKAIDTPRRIRILTVEESRRFWLHRIDVEGFNVDLDGVTRDEEKQGKNVDYERITKPNKEALEKGLPRLFPGVDFIIDECHVFFDARAWADTGLSLTYYNSQHRKLDDNVMFVTQFLELIDKRVKSFSQEFIYLRNNAAEKFMTLFRGPAYFTAKHYQRPPTGMQDMPSEVHRFTLDLPLAKCYDTSAGVGISGVGRPEAKRKKGLHIAWLLIPFFGLLYFLNSAPDWLASAIVGTKSGSYTASTLGLTSKPKEPAEVTEAEQHSTRTVPRSSVGGSSGASAHAELPPFPTGYVLQGRKVTVQMSDGTTRTERDDELTKIERNSVTLDGKKLFFRAKPADPSSASRPPAEMPVNQTQPPAVVMAGKAPEPSGWVMGEDGVYRSTGDIRAPFGK